MILPCISITIRGLVPWSVGRSVGRFVMLSSNLVKNGILKILNDLDSTRVKEGEEGGTKKKKGRGVRKDMEEGGTRRVKK